MAIALRGSRMIWSPDQSAAAPGALIERGEAEILPPRYGRFERPRGSKP